MKSNQLASILFLLIPLLFYCCKEEYIADQKICFEQEVYPIILSSCTQSECHNSTDFAARLDYTTYDGILQSVRPGSYSKSKLYDVITSPFSPMPPKPYDRLTKEQITTISLWIEQGANTKDTCSVASCDTSFVSFYALVKPILEVHCNGCHAGSRPQGGIDYNSFQGIKTTVDNGKLLGSIKRKSGYVFMPKNGNKLTDCKIAQIQKWVDAGAPNN